MQDNDGTPLAKKAETISYNDIYSTPDDRPKVSINKAYAERSEYVDDPSVNVKPSFTDRVKANLRTRYNSVASNVKRTVTIENAKRVGQSVITNAGNNMREDIGKIPSEVKQSVRTFGVVPVPRKGKKNKKNKKQSKNINNNVNTLNLVVKKRETTIHDVGVVPDLFAGKSSPKRNMNTNFELPAFSQSLKGNKTNSFNMNYDLPMFKKKKGGLF